MDKYKIILSEKPQAKIWFTSTKNKAIELARGLATLFPTTTVAVVAVETNQIIYEKTRETSYCICVLNTFTHDVWCKYLVEFKGNYDSEKILKKFYAEHPEYRDDERYYVEIC